ncbi:molybdopterin-dependent oxidoreductase [Actinoplanes sp. NPDC049118]|uniref:molybdopterin-dependent oxidoreductase n=1 Tax=Actinoplanes sp. NPDC049118 TaxID=3155769 RepID=UPI0033E1B16A
MFAALISRPTVGRSAASLAALLFLATSAVHLYWAGGGRWPGTDEASLAQRVIGDSTRFPSPAATTVVACTLAAAALLLLTRSGVLRLPLPRRVVAIGVGAIVVAVAARGLLGGVTSGVAVANGTRVPYFRLDLIAYSPLCLLLATLSAAALAVPPTSTADARRSTRRPRAADPIPWTSLWPRRSSSAALPPGQRELRVFPRFSDNPLRRPPAAPAQATLTVTGAVRHRLTIDLDELHELVPQTALTADFHCVTTWTVRNLTWRGALFADFWQQVVVPRCQPDPGARHLIVRGLDGVQAIIDLRDALEPDVLLADQLDGAPLGEVHGAPLRFVTPRQYGYKNIKHLHSIEVCRTAPPSTFGAKEHPRARVAFEERHATRPAWTLRWAYRSLVPLTARLAERSASRDPQR